MPLTLRSPSLELIDSYRGYLREFNDAGEELYPFTTATPTMTRLASSLV